MRYEVVEDGCWNWLGPTMPTGYGAATLFGRSTTAHRAVYLLLVGSIPPDFQVHHTCTNPRCVNPEHLEARLADEHRQLHGHFVDRPPVCKHGHPFDDKNTYFRRVGNRIERQCRRCKADRERTRQQRLRAQRL